MTTAGSRRFGCQSEFAPIRRLVLRHPRDAFRDDAAITAQWQALNYPAPPDLSAAIAEYERFVEAFEAFDIEIDFLDGDSTGLDSIYVHDPLLVSDRGAILCNMGKAARAAEPHAFHTLLEKLDVPVAGAITGRGRLEGGDAVWLDDRTVAVAECYRSNAEGIRQLRSILGDSVDGVISVPLPHWHGPDEVLHLMSIISPIDDDLAVVYSPLMPVPFRALLKMRGIKLIEVSDEEFESMGCNVLAIAPRRCLMVAGNPRTRAQLEAAGAEVQEYDGREISLKGGGGPTCLTRPIWRA